MIVYVGNMLSKHGSSINFMELLVPKLQEVFDVRSASSKRNRIVRLLEMMFCVILNRRRCKVVLIDTYSTSAFWYAYFVSIICRVYSIPYVPVLHGGNLPVRFLKDAGKVGPFLRNSDRVISPSLYLQDFFQREGFSIQFVPNFLEIDRYTYVPRPIVQPRILWVRAFQKIYNPMLAVLVLRSLVKTHPNAKLCMVGAVKDDSFEEVKRAIFEFNVSENIQFTGILSKQEWIRVAEDYDIFINTTTIDNMPISVIEAMALGLPVVSTKVGGIPYLIEDGVEGLLTEPGSADSMVAAIKMLIDDPVMASAIARRARSKVERYSWENVKGQWFEHLDHYYK